MSQGISFKSCGGIGAKAKLESIFTVEGVDRVYTLSGGDLVSPITINSTKNVEIVENLSAGEYTASLTYQGETIFDNFTVVDATVPNVYFSPATICSGQSSVLTVTGVAGASFTVTKPGGATNIVTIGINGTGTLPGITIGGEYTITANSSATGQCYPFTTSVELTVGGQSLTPTITLQPGNYCVGQVIPFRIEDGGINATYTVSSLGSGTISATVVASMTDFNGTFTPNTNSGAIKITGVTDTCNTTTTPQISVTSTTEPTLTGLVATCANDNSHTVSLTTNATTVTVEGVAATNISGQNWQRTGITGLTETDVVVTSATGCQKTQTIQLESCNCPNASLYITSDGDTCGQGSTNIYYGNIQGQTPSGSWNYIWQKNVNGTWTDLGAPAAYPVTPYTALTTYNVVDEYRLKLTNTVNGCYYYSDSTISVTAIQPPTNVSILNPEPIVVGQPVQFTASQQGFESYTWGGVASGNTYQSNSITFQQAGPQSVQLIVSNGICSETIVKQVIVNPISCTPNPITITNSQQYTNSCSDITLAVSGTNPGGLTYKVESQYINIPALTPVPNNGTLVIPTIAVPAGFTTELLVTVTDSLGCTNYIQLAYERCTCICQNNNCLSLQVYDNYQISTTKVIGTYAPLTKINWGFSSGQVPDRMQILENNIVILDTGNISSLSGCFAPDFVLANPSLSFDVNCVDTFLGDEGTLTVPGDPSSWVPNTGVSLLVGVGDVSPLAAQVCSGDNTKPKIVNTSNINGLTCQLGGELTLGGGELKVIIEPSLCGGPASWSYAIKCISL